MPDSVARSRSFLLLPFRNLARAEAQEWLVSGSPLMLADALGQYRGLTLVPDEQLVAGRRRIGLAPGAAPDAAQLRRLAEETGGWTAVTGNLVATGGRLRFTAQATDARTGRILSRASANIAADADVRLAFDSLAVQLLGVAGSEGPGSDLGSLSTRSIDAYRAYVRGLALSHQSSYRAAARAFEEAVRHDSTFAIAWARLALASAAWNVASLINPTSSAYRASERAASLVARLPPLLAAEVRAQSAFFRGDMARARALADSLIAALPDNLDAREFRASLNMLDPSMESGAPPRLRANPNSVVADVRHVLEVDPGRRYLYSILGFTYGIAGGMAGGGRAGTRASGGSFAMLMMTANEQFVPVLRDSFEVMTAPAFDALPLGERDSLRRRAASAGAQWMQRWLAAGPDDGEAHLWASRFAELQDSLPEALRHAEHAEARGIESDLEDVRGRRVMLLMRLGRTAEAGALADSMAAAGKLVLPMVALIDRGYAYGMAALLATGRLARAGDAAPNVSGDQACRILAGIFAPGTPLSLPDNIVAAVRESIGRHIGEIDSRPVLQRCLRQII